MHLDETSSGLVFGRRVVDRTFSDIGAAGDSDARETISVACTLGLIFEKAYIRNF
jgi:hypothetical protein